MQIGRSLNFLKYIPDCDCKGARVCYLIIISIHLRNYKMVFFLYSLLLISNVWPRKNASKMILFFGVVFDWYLFKKEVQMVKAYSEFTTRYTQENLSFQNAQFCPSLKEYSKNKSLENLTTLLKCMMLLS